MTMEKYTLISKFMTSRMFHGFSFDTADQEVNLDFVPLHSLQAFTFVSIFFFLILGASLPLVPRVENQKSQ